MGCKIEELEKAMSSSCSHAEREAQKERRKALRQTQKYVAGPHSMEDKVCFLQARYTQMVSEVQRTEKSYFETQAQLEATGRERDKGGEGCTCRVGPCCSVHMHAHVPCSATCSVLPCKRGAHVLCAHAQAVRVPLSHHPAAALLDLKKANAVRTKLEELCRQLQVRAFKGQRSESIGWKQAMCCPWLRPKASRQRTCMAQRVVQQWRAQPATLLAC